MSTIGDFCNAILPGIYATGSQHDGAGVGKRAPCVPVVMDSERRTRITASLLKSGIDAVICTSPSEVLLLTGYWPVMGTSVALVLAEGEACVILPEDEVELAEQSSAATLLPYKPSELNRIIMPIDALADPLGSLTARLGLSRARVGIQTVQGMQPASYATCADFHLSLPGDPPADVTQCDIRAVLRNPGANESQQNSHGIGCHAVGFRDCRFWICTGRGTD